MVARPPERLPDRIYSDILDRIVEGEFKEGQKLPTEQDLAQRFQTSRPTVREALARLRADGIIITRHGSGTTVARRPDPDVRRFAPLETLSDIQRCYEFRIILEPGAAALAAQHADAETIEKLEQTYTVLQQTIEAHGIGVREDFLFHLALAHASRNQYLLAALSFMEEQVVASINLLRNLSLVKSVERQQQVQAEHRAILDAIKAHDAPAAEAAMRLHLENARSRMFGT
jgi:DNA-binding FadR family transcriptional regulator